MSFRAINGDIMLRGAVLAIGERLFPNGVPSVEEYSEQSQVAPSTFQRAAQCLLGLLPGFLAERRPGPRAEESSSRLAREAALRKLEDLRSWLLGNRSATEKNDCYSGEAKQRIASISEEIQDAGVLTFAEIAETLGLNERHLRRIREEVTAAEGAAPQPENRRPQESGALCEEIQRLIEKIKESADSRKPYRGMDVKRILEKNYRSELLEHHGSETISETTVLKYLNQQRSDEKPSKEHPRGNYTYPQPFQQVAVDTSHFKLFGRVFYLITVFEFGGRLNLLTRVFLRESTEAVVEVIEEYLTKFPGVGVVVIDRGSPYLNEAVRSVIEAHGKLRLVCPSATPEAKACCERHFLTLKEVIRPAILKVFSEDPGWEPEKFQRVIEVAVAVFQALYHEIPQPGIDGLSPAQRASSFDPVKAHAAMLKLFQRAADSEPAEIYAREIHQRFQLPGTEEETVSRLKQFRTSALRAVVARVTPYMGPPWPLWMYDPLGYLAAKALEQSRKDQEGWHQEQLRHLRAAQARQAKKTHREELEAEDRQWREHPERFVDRTLSMLLTSLSSGVGRAMVRGQLKDLLTGLASQLAQAFPSEVARLKARIFAFTKDQKLRERAEACLEELVHGLSPAAGSREPLS